MRCNGGLFGNVSLEMEKLDASDHPTDALLLMIVSHVIYSEFSLLHMAYDVKMPKGLFTQKTLPHSEARMKIFEVSCFEIKL